MKLFKKIIGNLRIKMKQVVSYTHLSLPGVVDLVKQDPYSGTKLTINAALSLLTQSKPDIPYSQWKVPTLVFQPGADKMTPPKYTKRVYEQLGSTIKKYVEIEGAEHYPVKKSAYKIWAHEIEQFNQKI
jgi:alpha-beta hydrolase superfamily lysophospholipase